MNQLTRRYVMMGAALAGASLAEAKSAAALEQTSPVAGATGLVSFVPDAAGRQSGLFALDANDTVSPHDGALVIVDENGRRWKRVFDGAVRTEWFGQKGLALAHAAAVRLGRDLTFGATQYALAENLNLSSGRVYIFEPGARVSIAKEATLAIQGVVVAERSQIFEGAGRVIGMRMARPEWWGATRDGKSDSQHALQAALDCIAESASSDGDRQILCLDGNYLIGATLSALASANVNLRIVGSGTVFGGARLTAAKDFEGEVALHIRGQAENDLQAISDWGLQDFAVVAEAGSSCRTGVKIGEGNKSLIGLQKSRIAGVHSGGFAQCWLVTNARLIKFENCSGWADTVVDGVALHVGLESDDFTGDLEFESCQFVAPQDTGRAVYIQHARPYDRAKGPGGQVKGIYFSTCTFYKGETYVEVAAGEGAVLGDIWFDRCQWDGFGKTQFRLSAAKGSSIENVRLTNNYFRGVNDGFLAMHADIVDGATVRSIHISDNWIANCQSRAVLLRGIANLVFDQNSFVECAAKDSVVYLECRGLWQANLNALTQLGAEAGGFLTIGETGNLHGVAVGNSCDMETAVTDLRKSGNSSTTPSFTVEGDHLIIQIRDQAGNLRVANLELR